MKQLNNENGLTLLEMLATITILFIIGGIVASIFLQMFTNFNNSENRITARQEANLIIAHLTTIHQKKVKYTIIYDSPNYFIAEADGNSLRLGHKNYQYELKVGSKTLDPSTSPIEIDLKDSNNKSIDVQLKLANDNDEIEIKTTLARMTEAK